MTRLQGALDFPPQKKGELLERKNLSMEKNRSNLLRGLNLEHVFLVIRKTSTVFFGSNVFNMGFMFFSEKLHLVDSPQGHHTEPPIQ